MPTIVDTKGIDRLMARLRKIERPDIADLALSWMKIIDDDNRKGVLAGLDKDGNPMVPVTYRPKQPGVKLTPEQRLRQNARLSKGRYAPGAGNNLSSAEYRLLDGPPLAPRRQFSRVITNLQTRFSPNTGYLEPNGRLVVEGYWDGIVSRKGAPFMHYHFDGAVGGGRRRNVILPQRDLRGVRPEGREKAKKSLRAWILSIIRARG
jgi:hypothetical protein